MRLQAKGGWQHQKLGEAWNRPSLAPSGEPSPPHTLISDFSLQNCATLSIFFVKDALREGQTKREKGRSSSRGHCMSLLLMSEMGRTGPCGKAGQPLVSSCGLSNMLVPGGQAVTPGLKGERNF